MQRVKKIFKFFSLMTLLFTQNYLLSFSDEQQNIICHQTHENQTLLENIKEFKYTLMQLKQEALKTEKSELKTQESTTGHTFYLSKLMIGDLSRSRRSKSLDLSKASPQETSSELYQKTNKPPNLTSILENNPNEPLEGKFQLLKQETENFIASVFEITEKLHAPYEELKWYHPLKHQIKADLSKANKKMLRFIDQALLNTQTIELEAHNKNE